mgnify:CR=1 FL=1
MIELKDITKNYGDIKVFDKLNLSIEENTITCVLGTSGCGKTSLLNIIASITPYEGSILGFSGKVSYIFQHELLLPNLTVRQNLEYVLNEADYPKINGILDMLEIFDKADKYPRAISGGQAQRAAIARAFLFPSKLLLMDEPFSSLDTALKIRLITAFYQIWQKEKRTVLYVTHDIEEAFILSHRVLIMDKGNIVYDVKLDGNPVRDYGQTSADKQEILKKLLSAD